MGSGETDGGRIVASLRAEALARARADADRLEQVTALDRAVREAVAAGRSRLSPAAYALDVESIDDLVVGELQAAWGVSQAAAARWVHLARRAVRVLPRLVGALRAGLLDLARVRVVVEGTEQVQDGVAAAVVEELLEALAGAGATTPWQGPSPRAWRQRVDRAVVRADRDAARARAEAARAQRRVRAWSNGDGTGTFQATGPAEDVIAIDQVVQQLALSWPGTAADGTRLSMDQRRWHALVEVFARIARGHDLPAVTVRREREVGIVLHTDTLFGSGPHAVQPGELRGLGAPVTLDPGTARQCAVEQLAGGRAAAVLLADRTGRLDALVRLSTTPAAGWTRASLIQAVRAALPRLSPSRAPGYLPNTAIVQHVRAARPTCSGYDCPRTARRCDLDHDEPWPRGPTSVTNLDPKCRRHHQRKTLRRWRSRLDHDGSLTWTTLLGTTITSRHEPLPGCAEPSSGRPARHQPAA